MHVMRRSQALGITRADLDVRDGGGRNPVHAG